MCACANWLLSGAAAAAPIIDPNNPDHVEIELEAYLDAIEAA